MSTRELPKAYDASLYEEAIYQTWENSGVFSLEGLPERNQAGEPYCIMMPPPNRTGTLHLGHAMGMTIQDLMTRFERMRGKRALWIPGTDHAAIATQVKVEQLLIKEGYKDPRKELGREKFLQRVVEFADASRNTIVNQTRKMGSSCDWTRERYTFDEVRNNAVNAVFGMMWEDGIIERGYRLVNWDPQFQTTLSDDEVETKDVTSKLLTFTYDKDFPIAIATTRPETKFGDVAVAVHPADERYTQYVGKTFEPVFCGKKLSITVIADEAVDPSFGTGALGVTPAHSMIDAEMAQRHNLATIPVIGKDARMLPECGDAFAGKTIEETRVLVEERLQAEGVLNSVEDVAQALPIAQRGGAAVEQLPMLQWFVRVNKPFTVKRDTLGKWKKGDTATLKEFMLYAVESGKTRIVPERFSKIYHHWVNNLRDWCISRQIWFGHQIPVWYKDDETTFSATSPGEGWTQDPDTLDTWFSSGMWTFSALGWESSEQETAEWSKTKAFHPTALLETGYDILPFWVARMLLMSTYVLGEVPFRDTYLHGLVRDEQGRKMSKSLGNVLDPLELIPKYGTDAVRLSLLIGTTPGQDVKLSESKIESFRNFANKLWNIARFMLMQMGDVEAARMDAYHERKTLADSWIMDVRLAQVVNSVTQKLETYQFSAAGEELRDFTWNDVADWYLEITKVEGVKPGLLLELLQTLLKLWHPFMPFVTEAIWNEAGFTEKDGMLIVAPWPTQNALPNKQHDEFAVLQDLVVRMRRVRSERGIDAKRKLTFAVQASVDARVLMEANVEWMKRLANAVRIDCVGTLPEGWSTDGVVALNTDGVIDEAAEAQKRQEELTNLAAYIASLDAKLANAEFTAKAPAKVVDDMRAKRAEAQSRHDNLLNS